MQRKKLIVEIGPADFPLRTRMPTRQRFEEHSSPHATGLSKLKKRETYLGVGPVATHFNPELFQPNKVNFIVGDGRKLPLANESVDEIHAAFVEGFAQGLFPNTSVRLLRKTTSEPRFHEMRKEYEEQVKNGERLLVEAKRVLTKEGKLILGTSCTPEQLRDLKSYVKAHGFKVVETGFMSMPRLGSQKEILANLLRQRKELKMHEGLSSKQMAALASFHYRRKARRIVLARA